MSLTRLRIIVVFCSLLNLLPAWSQKTPIEIKYSVMDVYALRYYPFSVSADSLILPIIRQTASDALPYIYEQTAVDLTAHEQFVDTLHHRLSRRNGFVYRSFIRPYEPWLELAHSLHADRPDRSLSLAYFEKYKTNDKQTETQSYGILRSVGHDNVDLLINEVCGDIDLFQARNEIMQHPFTGPLTEATASRYHFYLAGTETIDGDRCHELVFFTKDARDNGFAGYLYITADEKRQLKRAVFSQGTRAYREFLRDILFVQDYRLIDGRYYPSEKSYYFYAGDEVRGSVMVSRHAHYSDKAFSEQPDSIRTRVEELDALASATPAYRRTRRLIETAITDHLRLGGFDGPLEFGSVTKALSYNIEEGMRIRLGMNTTTALNPHWLAGGYLAYGTADQDWKYRGNLIYSFLPKKRSIWEYPKRNISFTLVRDLEVPGYDLLTGNRDFFIYSITQSANYYMVQKKLGLLHYEHEFANGLSMKVGGQYSFERPIGRVQYPELSTTEANISLRYAPRERYIQIRHNRPTFQNGDIELQLNHRVGIPGILGSDHRYQVTQLSAYRKFYLPKNSGTFDFRLSAGKVWDRIPFPLLFIPTGNKGILYEEDDYNGMDYYEFVTDRFLAGKVHARINWTPLNLLWSGSPIQTSLGAKVIYGPLSQKNDPSSHSDLFAFPDRMRPLGSQPYVEVSVGLARILGLIQLQYVQRLTYTDALLEGRRPGSIFITADYIF